MRHAVLLVGQSLAKRREAVRPGVPTATSDAIDETHTRSGGATPACLGYIHPPAPPPLHSSHPEPVAHRTPAPAA